MEERKVVMSWRGERAGERRTDLGLTLIRAKKSPCQIRSVFFEKR
jgi:hypothetical protein